MSHVAPSATGSAGSSVAPPDRAIQFNRGGQFGGSQHALFYVDESSVVIGEDSSIDAASFLSCQVFGHDCHIAD